MTDLHDGGSDPTESDLVLPPPPPSDPEPAAAPAAPDPDPEPVAPPDAEAPAPATGTVAALAATGEAPPKRTGRQRRSEWRRAEKARRYAARNSVRFPIFTRSVLLWMLIFALVGVAFGASGAFWWAHFNTQVSQLRSDTQDFETRSQSASADIEKQKNDATDQINAALEPLKDSLAADQDGAAAATYSPSVYQVVHARRPGPALGRHRVRRHHERGRDLDAHLVHRSPGGDREPGARHHAQQGRRAAPGQHRELGPGQRHGPAAGAEGRHPVLDWAGDDVLSKALGSSIFPISGTGGAGATITSGMLIDQSTAGFQHTAPLGTDFQGGPVINGDGKVLGIASLDLPAAGLRQRPDPLLAADQRGVFAGLELHRRQPHRRRRRRKLSS